MRMILIKMIIANTLTMNPRMEPKIPMFANRLPNNRPASPPIISPFIRPPEKNPLFAVVVDLLVVVESDFLFWKNELLLLVVVFELLLKLFFPDLYDFASTVVV